MALTPREPVTTAADIGTGCGVQALLLARHAERVIATDISARALHLTALGAALAGATNIDLRQGSLLEPLTEDVDLLVSNPPFVITPQGRQLNMATAAGDETLTIQNPVPGEYTVIGHLYSAPAGTERNCWTRPFSGPWVGMRNIPSAAPMVPGAPSVEIHRWSSWSSKHTLSGQLIGETRDLSSPLK